MSDKNDSIISHVGDDPKDAPLAEKVRALSEAGFSDSEIKRILLLKKDEESKEHNEHVEDVVQILEKNSKAGIFLGLYVLCFMLFMFNADLSHEAAGHLITGHIVAGWLFVLYREYKMAPMAHQKMRFFFKK